MRLLIAGGGTGGHVFPGVALAEEVVTRHPDNDVVFVGIAHGLRADRLGNPAFDQMLGFFDQFFVDPLNVFLVALTAFVGFTTSLFSRPYMRIERDKGRMTPARLRLYHSMYQVFTFTMLLALTTNNMGILWVAMEAATLATVLLVSVYRTAASLEAAWKYFILCGVGIAQALFGTILLYFVFRSVLNYDFFPRFRQAVSINHNFDFYLRVGSPPPSAPELAAASLLEEARRIENAQTAALRHVDDDRLRSRTVKIDSSQADVDIDTLRCGWKC